jgi:hypothetical protein
MESTYRLVPSEKAAKGLGDGTLRWATAKKGDASVLVKNKATGRIAGHGELRKVSPSPAKVLGPAAWEAMAMATQQHYLVEINDKLEDIARGVDEVLDQMSDDKRGTLKDVRGAAEFIRTRLDEGKLPSPTRRDDFRREVRDADRVWHQIHETMSRRLAKYRQGEETAARVEESWTMLLFATQVLAESSALLTELPYDTVEELEEATSEERARMVEVLAQIRALAAELHGAYLEWSRKTVEYNLRRTRNPARKAVRAVRRDQAVEPAQRAVDDITAWRASQLAMPPRPPAALLVSIHEDGSVEVAAESADEPLSTTAARDET